MRYVLLVLISITMSLADVVTDSDTGLMWQDDSDAKTITKTWQEAIEYCDGSTLGGYEDWRLPTYKELLSIVDKSRYYPAIKDIFTNTYLSRYWSATTNESNSDYAWYVHFSNGYSGSRSKSNSHYVRCVRVRQSGDFDNLPVVSDVALISESPKDYDLKKEPYLKEWVFGSDISGYSVEVVSSTYSSYGSITKDSTKVSMTLTPETTKTENKIVLQLKDSSGGVVKVDHSDTFWAISKTNFAPRLADGHQVVIAGKRSDTLSLAIDAIDDDKDSVSVSVVDSAGGSVSIADNVLSISNLPSSTNIHTIKLSLSDGKESSIVQITALTVDSDSIKSFYTDVSDSYIYSKEIAFTTLMGITHGYPSSSDSSKREYRPNDNVSWAEALKMVMIAGQKAGLISLPKIDSYYSAYPNWVMPYYTQARDKGAMNLNRNDLSLVYPSREEIAHLIVKSFDLEQRMEGFADIDELDIFSDEDTFSSSEYLHSAKLTKAFGLALTGSKGLPTSKVSRGYLAKIISKIFMLANADITTTPQTIEYKDSFEIGYVNITAQKIDDNYNLVSSASEVTKRQAINKIEKTSTTIDSSTLNVGINVITAILSNNGVNNFISRDINVIFTDSDNDGVQDREDVWPNDARYYTDENGNNIPDILDFIYNLSENTIDDTITINGESVTVEELITNGGYSESTNTISLIKGWNLVSANITNVNNISTKAKILWKYNNDEWHAYSNNPDIKTVIENGDLPTFSSLVNENGFWILANEAFKLEVLTNDTVNGGSFENGWHLLGTGDNTPLSNYGCISGEMNSAWKYVGNTWQLNTSIENDLGFESFDTINVNEGFWINWGALNTLCQS